MHRLVTGTFVLALLIPQADPLDAQRLRGVIVESESGNTVADAAVTLLDREGSPVLQVVSDPEGRFSLPLPQARAYSLRVEKLGYATVETAAVTVASAEVLEVTIRVGREAVPLEPLEVTARRLDTARTHADFYRRLDEGRRTGFGYFMTRDEIERAPQFRVSSLLANVPHVRLQHTRDGRALLGVSERGSLVCSSAVFLNGMIVNASYGLDELVTADDLEGVEVYRWQSELPTELARPGVCTAVAFWTRAGSSAGTWTWRRLVLGGAALGAALFVGFLR